MALRRLTISGFVLTFCQLSRIVGRSMWNWAAKRGD
jgi:hypothetical protein